MTSDRLTRDLRNFADNLGLTFVGRVAAGAHHKLTFATAAGREITIPIPKGTISEGGPLVLTLRKQIERAAR